MRAEVNNSMIIVDDGSTISENRFSHLENEMCNNYTITHTESACNSVICFSHIT